MDFQVFEHFFRVLGRIAVTILFVAVAYLATGLAFFFLAGFALAIWIYYLLREELPSNKARLTIAAVIVIFSAWNFGVYPMVENPLPEDTKTALKQRKEALALLVDQIVKDPSAARRRYLEVACDQQQEQFDADLRGKLASLSIKPLSDLSLRGDPKNPSLLSPEERDVNALDKKIALWRKECSSRPRLLPASGLMPKTLTAYWLGFAWLFIFGFGLWKKSREGTTRWMSFGGFMILVGIYLVVGLFLYQAGTSTVSEWVKGVIPKSDGGSTTSTSAISVSATHPGDLGVLLKADEGKRVTINFVRDDFARSVFYTLPKCVGKRIHTEVIGGPWDADWPVLQQWLEDGTYLDFRDVPAPYFREPKLAGYTRGKIPVVPLRDLPTRLEGGGRVAIFQTATLALWCEPIT